MSPFSADDADDLKRKKGKPRPKGTLPYLPERAQEMPPWLTLAFRPAPDYAYDSNEREGKLRTDAIAITFRNGRDRKTFRFAPQSDLMGSRLRSTVLAISDGWLRMGHLTPAEIDDVWAALCIHGRLLSDYDEREEALVWMHQLLNDAEPMIGFSLVPDGRRDALLELRRRGEFTKRNAQAWSTTTAAKVPVRVVDAHTAEQYVRTGETITYLRWVAGVEPLSWPTLRSRFAGIGVEWRSFEDYRPPYPKATMFRLTEELIAYAEAPK